MDHRITIFSLAIVGAVVAASAAAAAGGGSSKVTICHHPGEASERTMQVPRSAVEGHKGHGDHEGACRAAGAGTPPSLPPPPPAPPTPPPTTHLEMQGDGEGDLDGDATFEVTVYNSGSEAGKGLRINGTLAGDGDWRVRDDGKATCTTDGGRLACTLSDLGAGGRRTLRLVYDGHTTLCREAGIDLALTASNDATADDDRVEATVRVGVCSAFGDGDDD